MKLRIKQKKLVWRKKGAKKIEEKCSGTLGRDQMALRQS